MISIAFVVGLAGARAQYVAAASSQPPVEAPQAQQAVADSQRVEAPPARHAVADSSASKLRGVGRVAASQDAATSYASDVLADSPSVYYLLDETGCCTATDSSGNGVTGTYASGVEYGIAGAILTEPSETAASSEGGAFVSASASTLPSGNSSRTLELWFKTSESGDNLIRYGDLYLAEYSADITFQINSHIYTFDTPVTVTDDTWHYLALSYTGVDSSDGSATVILDGQQLGTQATVNATTSTSGTLLVGTSSGTTAMDEVAIYPWALSTADLLDHYEAAVTDTCPSAPTSSYAADMYNDGPSRYYPLGETTGTTMVDYSGNCNDGQYGSDTTHVSGGLPGDSNGAAHSGGGGPMGWASADGLPSGNSSRTIEAWFEVSGSAQSGDDIASYGDLALVEYSTYLAFTINGHEYDFTTPNLLTDGNWHYVALSYTDVDSGAGSAAAYIDGQPLGTQSTVNAVSTTTGTLNVGPVDTGVMSLEEFAIYPSALSASQLAAHWQAGIAATCPSVPSTGYGGVVEQDSPSRFYRLDETSGTVMKDYSGNCSDGSYYHATPVSGALLTETDGATQATGEGYNMAFASASGLPSGNSSRTIEAWFNASGSFNSGDYIVSYGDLSLVEYSTYIAFTINGQEYDFDVAGPLTDGNWHYMALAFTDVDSSHGSATLYLDGSKVATQSTVNAVTAADGILHVGPINDGTMAVDEVAIYSTTVSAAQVKAHYLASGNTPPPVDGAETSRENGGSCTCDSSNTGDPVNTTSGNYYEQAADISIAGRSLPLEMVRTYNSQDASVAGPFGYGWNYNYGTSLAVSGTSPNEIATITMANGDQETFDQPASGNSWSPSAPRFIDTLTDNSGSSTWTLDVKNEDTYTFNSSGQLTQETDLNGYTTSFSYTSGNLTAVTDPAGRTLTLGWTGSNITSVTDSSVSENTRTVSYSYDSNGNLEDVIDVNGGDTHYEYNTSHQMTVMKDPVCEATSGCPGIQNDYNSSGQVDWQKDQLNRETTFSYSGTPYAAAGGSTHVTDPAGNETDYQYQWGLLTAETVGYGTSDAATTRNQYDPSTLSLIGVEDPNGNITSYTRDSSGNVITTADPLGRVTANTYNSFNEVLTTEDGNGVTTTNTYNSNGDLTTTSTPLTNATATGTNCASPTTAVAVAAVTCYAYGDSTYPGDLTAVTDPDGNVTDYQYDAYGNRDEVKDPAGHVTATEYNADDWALDTLTPKAGCTWGSALPTGCSSTYETQYDYDAPGTSTINEFGLVGTVTNPLGATTETTYDGDGRTLTVEDGDGNTTTSAYDLAGELCWTLPGGTSSAGCSSPATNAQVTTYNSDGTVDEQKDGKGDAIITYGYNHRGQVTSTEDALGNTTTYTLDADGHRLTKLDPVSGATCSGTKVGCTTYTYDADTELTSVSYSDSPSEEVTSITYDSDGQQTGMTDGTGSSTWVYDSLHRLTSDTDGNGDTVDYGYTYGSGPTYDLKDQVRSITYPNSVGTVDQTWNTDGTLASVTDWNGKETTSSYDANGNETGQTVPSTTNVTDTFGYGAADQMTSVSDVAGSTTLFSDTYTRDDNGQVTGDSSVPSTVGSYQYTALNQLCYAGSANTTACPSPPSGSQAYAFDGADNLTTNNGTTQQFNAADELCWTVSGTSSSACSAAPSGATTYGYDTKGNLTSEVPSSGPATCYTYDQADRLTEVQTGTGSTCTSPTTVAAYSYDGNGVRQSKTVSGTTTHFTWGGSGGELLQQKAGSTVTSFICGPNGPVEQITGSTTTYLHRDQLGSIRLITDSAGSSSTATTMTYDPYGNVTSTSGSLTSPFGFADEYTDSESGLLHTGARYYDPSTGQFLTVDPKVAATLSPYGYLAGDPLNGTDPSGEWGLPGWVTTAAGAVGGALNAALPAIHAVATVVAIAASACAVLTSATIIGGVTCGAIALGASAVTAGTSDILYAENRETEGQAVLDTVGLGLSGAGSVFEALGSAAQATSDTDSMASGLYQIASDQAPWYSSWYRGLQSMGAGIASSAWGAGAALLGGGSRGLSAGAFGFGLYQELSQGGACGS
jgi:RHS repeat-associated protein